MILRNSNGTPYVYMHKCEDCDYGMAMSLSEINDFLVEQLVWSINCSYKGNVRISSEQEKENLGCDFIFKEHYNRKVLGYVRYFDDVDDEIEFLRKLKESDSFFASMYPAAWKACVESEGKVTAVFYIGRPYCEDTKGGYNICGGHYTITFDAYECCYPVIPTVDVDLPVYDLYMAVAVTVLYNGPSALYRGWLGQYPALYLLGGCAGIVVMVQLGALLAHVFGDGRSVRFVSTVTLLMCGFHLLFFAAIKGVVLLGLHKDPAMLSSGVGAGFLYAVAAFVLCLPAAWAVERFFPWLVYKR